MFFVYTPEKKEDIPCHPVLRRSKRNQTWFLEGPAEHSVMRSQPAPWEGKLDQLGRRSHLNVNAASLGKEQQWKPATSKYPVSTAAASGLLSKALCWALPLSIWVTIPRAKLHVVLCSSLVLSSGPSTIHLLQLRDAGIPWWCYSQPLGFRNGRRKSSVNVPYELWQDCQCSVTPKGGGNYCFSSPSMHL